MVDYEYFYFFLRTAPIEITVTVLRGFPTIKTVLNLFPLTLPLKTSILRYELRFLK